jgi:hypothetical protein
VENKVYSRRMAGEWKWREGNERAQPEGVSRDGRRKEEGGRRKEDKWHTFANELHGSVPSNLSPLLQLNNFVVL